MRPLRILAGAEPCDLDAMRSLVHDLAALAQEIGLTVLWVRMSKNRCSRSRYLLIRDRAGRDWSVRVSNHHRPNSSLAPPPHIDIITRDGRSGRDEALGLIDRVASGDIAWAERETGWHRPRRRR